MTDTTLAIGHLLTFLEGVGYILVSEFLRKRFVTAEWRLPSNFFRAWWLLIGSNKIAAALMGAAWLLGIANDTAYIALLYVNLLVLCVSLAALMSYFSFLLSGRHRWYYFIAASYIAYYLLLTYHTAAGQPSGVGVGEWRTFHLSTGSEPLRGLIVLAGLALPQLIAALVYVGLIFRVHDRTSVYRIVLVASSIVAWTLSIVFVSLPFFDTNATIQVASRLLGMAGAAAAILAYRPPWFLGRLLHLRSLEEAVHPRTIHHS